MSTLLILLKLSSHQRALTLDLLYCTHLPSGPHLVQWVSQTTSNTLSSELLLDGTRRSYDSAELGLHALSDPAAVAVALALAVMMSSFHSDILIIWPCSWLVALWDSDYSKSQGQYVRSGQDGMHNIDQDEIESPSLHEDSRDNPLLSLTQSR